MFKEGFGGCLTAVAAGPCGEIGLSVGAHGALLIPTDMAGGHIKQ
jgi:hypothetical protein